MGVYVDRYCEYLEKKKKLAKNTVASYRRDLVIFENYLSGVSRGAENADAHDVASFFEHLSDEGKSNATIARYAVSLHRFYIYLVREGVTERDMTLDVEIEKGGKKLPRALSFDEVTRLLDAPCTDTFKGIRDKAMLELLYASGIKVSELVALDVRDVDVKGGALRISDAASPREIPIGKTACDALKSYLENARAQISDRREKALFVSLGGRRMTRQGFWKTIQTYAAKAGIKGGVTPQMLRNSFAVHLLQNGADVNSVADMLGHKDIHSTLIFEEVKRRNLKKVYKNAHPRA